MSGHSVFQSLVNLEIFHLIKNIPGIEPARSIRQFLESFPG